MLGVVNYTDQFHYIQKLVCFLSSFMQAIEPASSRMIQHLVVSRQMNLAQTRLHYLVLQRQKCMLISTRRLGRLGAIHREMVGLILGLNQALSLSTNYPLFAVHISDPTLIRKATKAYLEISVHLRVFVLIQINGLASWVLKLINEAESVDFCRGLFGWRKLDMSQVPAVDFTQNCASLPVQDCKRMAKNKTLLDKGSLIPLFLQSHLS